MPQIQTSSESLFHETANELHSNTGSEWLGSLPIKKITVILLQADRHSLTYQNELHAIQQLQDSHVDDGRSGIRWFCPLDSWSGPDWNRLHRSEAQLC
ncbi:hypothetical protein NPIL_133101 [Nephila pilipes]|uniref:Uncharacterized protein n=1 Tax=Nephila pilipes TaxID=299642 RepID=A0A8X6PHV6_NEPPI|nr:hypothetical protein NPIL_133101 [Nephila pilipes]